MMSAADWLRMKAEMELVRRDRSIPVQFRRGDTVLDEQEIRVEALGRGAKFLSDAGREARITVCIFGATDLDVAIDDRFTEAGVLYRVTAIAPNRDVDTQAEAVAVE
jgi:hypothetical protein